MSVRSAISSTDLRLNDQISFCAFEKNHRKTFIARSPRYSYIITFMGSPNHTESEKYPKKVIRFSLSVQITVCGICEITM